MKIKHEGRTYTVTKERLDRGGYSGSGRYFGQTPHQSVFSVELDEDGFVASVYTRASDYKHAVQQQAAGLLRDIERMRERQGGYGLRGSPYSRNGRDDDDDDSEPDGAPASPPDDVNPLIVMAGDDGYHPKYRHLVIYEAEPHYGSWIITSPAASGSILMEDSDYMTLFDNGEARRNGLVYGHDAYLDLFDED